MTATCSLHRLLSDQKLGCVEKLKLASSVRRATLFRHAEATPEEISSWAFGVVNQSLSALLPVSHQQRRSLVAARLPRPVLLQH